MCKVERKSRVSYIKVTVSYKVQLVSIYKTVSGAQGGGQIMHDAYTVNQNCTMEDAATQVPLLLCAICVGGKFGWVL